MKLKRFNWTVEAGLRRRPTIADVAKLAGVSVGTVSHMLNGTANVKPATRARIDAAIETLSYRPSAVARFLPAKRNHGQPVDHLRLPRLISVGYISVDYVTRVGVIPHRGDRVSAEHIEKCLGGPAANVAVAAAGLGGGCALDVVLATAIGADPDSDWAMAELAARGVDALPIRAPFNGRLSRCVVIVEANGSRTIINEPFELAEVDLAAKLAAAPETRPACLHIEGYHALRMAETMRRFRAFGWKVSVHTTGLPAQLRSADRFMRLIATVDLLFLNEDLLREVFSWRGPVDLLIRALAERLAAAPRRGDVVLTLGERGAVLFPSDSREVLRSDALAVDLIDATGAGDAFAGAFLGLRLNGRPRLEALRLACAAGSLAVTAQGAQERICCLADLEAAVAAAMDPRQAMAS